MVNKATFYTLSEDKDKFDFCVKLCSQIWRKKNQKYSIWIICNSISTINLLDKLFWQIDEDSFIPHLTLKHFAQFDSQTNCIILSLAMPIPEWTGVIVNFSGYTVNQFIDNNIIEIISHLEKDKLNARIRFKEYKQNNFNIKTYLDKGSNKST